MSDISIERRIDYDQFVWDEDGNKVELGPVARAEATVDGILYFQCVTIPEQFEDNEALVEAVFRVCEAKLRERIPSR